MEIIKIITGLLKSNCYLLIQKDNVLIVDPGDDYEKILNKIKGQVQGIILTHYHFDHIEAAIKIKEKTNAPIMAHEAEVSFLNISIDKKLKDEDIIYIGEEKIKVIHTPGHSKGSICLLGKNFLITGDTFFENGYGRTDLPGGSDQEIIKSLKKIKEIIKSGMIVYPGHGNIINY